MSAQTDTFISDSISPIIGGDGKYTNSDSVLLMNLTMLDIERAEHAGHVIHDSMMVLHQPSCLTEVVSSILFDV